MSLGELIQEIRLAKEFTQMDVVEGFWKEGERLGDHALISKWETNQYIPSARNLSILAKVLGISYVEEKYWRGLAGYLPKTRMPTLQQIREHLSLYSEGDIRYDPFPSIIVDYRFTIWALNEAARVVLDDPQFPDIRAILRMKPTLLDMQFHSKIDINKAVDNDNIPAIRELQVQLFKAFNLHRRHEPFYSSYPQCLKGRFAKNYNEFEGIWNAINVENTIALTEGAIKAFLGYLTPNLHEPIEIKQRLEYIPHFPQFAMALLNEYA